MENRKLKLLDELLSYLDDSQASSLKSKLEEKRSMLSENSEAPKGIKIESVEILDKNKNPDLQDKLKEIRSEPLEMEEESEENPLAKESEDELTEEELEELVRSLV